MVTGFPSKTLCTARASMDEAGYGGKLVLHVGIPAFIVGDRNEKNGVSGGQKLFVWQMNNQEIITTFFFFSCLTLKCV